MSYRPRGKLDIAQVVPGISETDLKRVAEVLACVDPDPARRRDHRIQKLGTFAADDRDRIRSIANRVITARGRGA